MKTSMCPCHQGGPLCLLGSSVANQELRRKIKVTSRATVQPSSPLRVCGVGGGGFRDQIGLSQWPFSPW